MPLAFNSFAKISLPLNDHNKDLRPIYTVFVASVVEDVHDDRICSRLSCYNILINTKQR